MAGASENVQPDSPGTTIEADAAGPWESDAVVIASSVEDPAQFGKIFDRYFDAIWSYAVSRVGREEGADVASQVFTLAFEQRQRFDVDYESARPWLYGIARNLIRRRFRSRARGDRAFSRLAGASAWQTDDHATGVIERVDAQTRLALVMKALDQMAPSDREMLLLHAWDGLSYAEIAATMGVPAGTVRSRLSRGRRKLEELVGPIGQEGDGNP